MTVIRGRIVTPECIVEGCLAVEDGRITKIGNRVHAPGREYDFGSALVVPGFLDVHMHGLGRHSFGDVSGILEAARMQLRFGTTGFLPTVACLPPAGFLEFGQNVRKAAAGETARIIGAHFEGPFINPLAKGGMDEVHLRAVDLQECKTYIDQAGDVLKLMTLSPELPGGDELIRLLRRNGVVVSLGHTRASAENLREAVDAGASHVCHLFNTFERAAVHHAWPEAPSLLHEILHTERLNCEIICDMFHVPPAIVKRAAATLGPDRFVAITDSLPGAGLAPGTFKMSDGREFTTQTGVARLTADDTIVGSVLTMNRAFANLVQQCGLDPLCAARFTSTNPARAIGVADQLGSIEVGKLADLAVLDSHYTCIATFLAGQMLHGTEPVRGEDLGELRRPSHPRTTSGTAPIVGRRGGRPAELDLRKCRVRTPTGDALLHLYEMLKGAFAADRPVFTEMAQKDRRYYTWTPHALYLDEELLGNVSLVPIRIWLGGELTQIVGIASVATVEPYRNRGVARHLMQHCLEIVDRQGRPCVLFTDLPAVYERAGFSAVEQTYRTAPAERIRFAAEGFDRQVFHTLSPDQIERMSRVYAQEYPRYDGSVDRDPQYWQLYEMLVNLFPKPRIVFCSDKAGAVGYGRFELEADRLLVCEICARESADELTEALLSAAGDAARSAGVERVSFALPEGHSAWRALKRHGVPLEPEPPQVERETFMVRPARSRPLGPLERLQWSLADKF